MLWKYIRQKSFVEVVALFLGGVGFVLLVAPFQVSATLGHLGELGAAIAQSLVSSLRQVTAYHALGLLLLVGSTTIVVERIRYRLRASERLTAMKCPACGSELHRSHRHLSDRAIALFVPVGRYRCRNRQCSWRGLRVKPLS